MKATKHALASDKAARGALKAMGFSDEEATGHLVRGNLRWQFFKKWAGRGVFVIALYVFAGRRLLAFLAGRNDLFNFLSWPTFFAVVAVAAIALYFLGGVWAGRVFKRYDWVDDGDIYRPVAKK